MCTRFSSTSVCVSLLSIRIHIVCSHTGRTQQPASQRLTAFASSCVYNLLRQNDSNGLQTLTANRYVVVCRRRSCNNYTTFEYVRPAWAHNDLSGRTHAFTANARIIQSVCVSACVCVCLCCRWSVCVCGRLGSYTPH